MRLLPAICAGVSGSLFSGFYMKMTGKYYWLTVVGYWMLPVGCLLIVLFSGIIANNTYAIALGLVLCGFGNGIGVTTTLIALSEYIDSRQWFKH